MGITFLNRREECFRAPLISIKEHLGIQLIELSKAVPAAPKSAGADVTDIKQKDKAIADAIINPVIKAAKAEDKIPDWKAITASVNAKA